MYARISKTDDIEIVHVKAGMSEIDDAAIASPKTGMSEINDVAIAISKTGMSEIKATSPPKLARSREILPVRLGAILGGDACGVRPTNH